MSEWVDLTQPIVEDMPVRPLHVKPVFEDLATLKEDSYNSTLIHIETHSGTHMDAPTHYLEKSEHRSIHEWSADEMVSSGTIFDFSWKDTGAGVGADEVESKVDEFGLDAGDYAIFKFDLEPEDSDRYLMNYNYLELDTAEYLVSQGISCVATESLNIEKSGKPVLESNVHYELLGSDVFIVEGLTNLDQVEEGRHQVICAPLPYSDRDGSQVRFIVRPY